MAKESVDISFVHGDTPMRVGITGQFGWIGFNVNHKHSKRHNYKAFGFNLDTIGHVIAHLESIKAGLKKKGKDAKGKGSEAKGSAGKAGLVRQPESRREAEDSGGEGETKARSKSEQRRLAVMKESDGK